MPSRALPNLGLQAFFNLGEDDWNDEMDLNLLTLSALCQAVVLEKVSSLPGSPSNGEVYLLDETEPTNPNAIAIRDDDAWVYVDPDEGWAVYNQFEGYVEQFDGTAWAELATGGSTTLNYDFGFIFEATPDEDAILGRVRIGRAITIPADMAGSSGGVATNPTSTFDIDVQDDGVSIGTISVATGGTVTFATASGTLKNVAAGSEITFVAPSSADATVAGMSAVILATVD